MSRELDDIASALHSGIDAASIMRDTASHWSRREYAERCLSSLRDGQAALERLRRDLRDGRKHVEPPDDLPPRTSCYCSEPTCSPPCGWCTEPHNEEETP